MVEYGNELAKTRATIDVSWVAGEGTTRAYSPVNLFHAVQG